MTIVRCFVFLLWAALVAAGLIFSLLIMSFWLSLLVTFLGLFAGAILGV
jgi:hypothetical protein